MLYVVTTINLFEHLVNVSDFFLNGDIVLGRRPIEVGLEWLLDFSLKVCGRTAAPLNHITILFMVTSFLFCLNYTTFFL